MQRTREVAGERSTQLKFRVQAHASELERTTLLERHGFGVDRYFRRMVRSLDIPFDPPQLPEGFRLVTGPHSPATWAALFNQSFVDHWNHEDWSAEKVQHWQDEPSYRRDTDLIAVAPDGTLAAFCWGGLEPEAKATAGQIEGRIGLLGTRRGYRGIGLGRAMLLAGLQALQAAGAASVWLSVDANSPTGAQKLYESAGFRNMRTRMLYGREL